MNRDDYFNHVDRTAERGSTTERIIGLVASVLIGGAFLLMVGIAFYGWLS